MALSTPKKQNISSQQYLSDSEKPNQSAGNALSFLPHRIKNQDTFISFYMRRPLQFFALLPNNSYLRKDFYTR